MTPDNIFFLLVAILAIGFIIDSFINTLNANHFNDSIPKELENVFDEESYVKSQEYKKANQQFSSFTKTISFIGTIAFFLLDGFQYVDTFARSFSENSIMIALIFFGIILIGSDILTTPLSYYKVFVIEEKFGFNKSEKKNILVIQS